MSSGNISNRTYESFLGRPVSDDWAGYYPGASKGNSVIMEGVEYTVVRNPTLFWATDTGREIRKRMDLAEKERRPYR